MPPSSASDAPMDLSIKSRRKLRLEEFLRQNLDEAPAGRVIEWVDRSKGAFRILWTHQSSGAFTHDDAALFRYWALARGKPSNLSSVELKQSLRMALNKSPSVERIDMPHDEFRYFRFTAWSSRGPASFQPSDSSSFKRSSPSASPPSSPKARRIDDSEETPREPRQMLRDLLTRPEAMLHDQYLARKTLSPSSSSSSLEDAYWHPAGEDLPSYHAYDALTTTFPVRYDDPSPPRLAEADDHLSRRVPSRNDPPPPPPSKPLALRSDLFQPSFKSDLYSFYPPSLKADLWERQRHYESWTSYFARESSDSSYAVPSSSDGFRPYDHYGSFYANTFPYVPAPHIG